MGRGGLFVRYRDGYVGNQGVEMRDSVLFRGKSIRHTRILDARGMNMCYWIGLYITVMFPMCVSPNFPYNSLCRRSIASLDVRGMRRAVLHQMMYYC